ncbi:NADH:flavin oxidoreductase [Vibrio sp. DW001]|uniref:NADH:flavin oxidoreductase n=1 Tax=Vibrio sp. DW001 TaxID=2912315 RepID=UPI0023B0316F|nr:NADH:flavin oxidoreductase [Vibrio sp. DW001]WED28497.1 NADH:flavin oxidoreductase [Vibrio sp. DW001]
MTQLKIPDIAKLSDALNFNRGPNLKNRFVLAPLTNTHNHSDGTVSSDEIRWLDMCSKGGFGMIITAAAHIQKNGQGYVGQLGAYDDQHLAGLTQLANTIKSNEAIACLQLAHSGKKAIDIKTRVSPSSDIKSNAKALKNGEIEQLIGDYVRAALKAEKAGFDGVEIHAAHGFLPTQFLSSETNTRTDKWGGSLENRSRLIFSILKGIRSACSSQFMLGLRLSPERFGLKLPEMLELARQSMQSELIDWLDLSLWDVNKEPEDIAFKGKTTMSWFTSLERANTRIGVAGKIMSAQLAAECLASGADFVLVGRGAIVACDFPNQAMGNSNYQPPKLPVSAHHLRQQGLGDKFIDYMKDFPNFVKVDK